MKTAAVAAAAALLGAAGALTAVYLYASRIGP